jgi:hypothetical protein
LVGAFHRKDTAMSKINRRSALTALAALPALAAPAAVIAAAPDPIFAAIEEHRAANLRLATAMQLDASRPADFDGPEAASWDEVNDAQMQLVDVTPTTVAGVVALLQYVEDFCAGKIRADDDY